MHQYRNPTVFKVHRTCESEGFCTVTTTDYRVHSLKLLLTITIYHSRGRGRGANSLQARLSVLRTLSSALYRMDAVVTLHTSDKYTSTTQTCCY